MLIDIATASPPFKVTQPVAAQELKKRMAGSPAVGRMIDMAAHHSGIAQRFFVIPDGEERAEKKFFSDKNGYVSPDTKTRMTEYERWSKELAGKAVADVLSNNATDGQEIERLITVSCTDSLPPDWTIILSTASIFQPM